MIPFSLCLLAVMIGSCLCFLLGSHLSYRRGADDGFEDGYQFASQESEIRWRITATGEAALAAARQEVPLSIHPSHLQLPPQ